MTGLDKKNTYVLLIGASTYPNWEAMNIPNVQVNLREFEALLLDPFYCGISIEQIKVIEDENIEDTNNAIQEFFNSIASPQSTVIFYYSGHGLQSVKAMDDLFLATRNIREKTFEASSIKISELRRLFSECIASRKILLLDCCYAGKITKGFMTDNDSDSIAKLNDFEGTYIMAASSEYERARFDPEAPNLPTKFTGQFIEVIKNGIESDDEYCTLHSIYNQIRNTFLIQKDAPRPIQIGQNNIGNLPVFKNKKFLEKIPKDEELWNKIIILDTLYNYNLFLEQFPDSKYKEEAERKIQYLEDEDAWKKSCNRNTIGGYRNYINNYTNHIEKAKTKLRDISLLEQEREIWQSAISENKLEYFKTYCETYPNGVFADEARQIIKRLTEKETILKLQKKLTSSKDQEQHKQKNIEEDEFWKQVLAEDTINLYQSYIKNYPNGRYRDQAIQKIDNNEKKYVTNVFSAQGDDDLTFNLKPRKIPDWILLARKFVWLGLAILSTLVLIWFLGELNQRSQTIKSTNDPRDSIYGKKATLSNGGKTRFGLYYTDAIDSVDVKKVLNLMNKQSWELIIDTISYQLDRDNDTVLFKYNLYNKEEATPAVKNSMQVFGRLLSDTLFRDVPLKVVGYNISEKVEYLFYMFNSRKIEKETFKTNTLNIARKLTLQEEIVGTWKLISDLGGWYSKYYEEYYGDGSGRESCMDNKYYNKFVYFKYNIVGKRLSKTITSTGGCDMYAGNCDGIVSLSGNKLKIDYRKDCVYAIYEFLRINNQDKR